jgi:hypothetical protein
MSLSKWTVSLNFRVAVRQLNRHHGACSQLCFVVQFNARFPIPYCLALSSCRISGVAIN